MGKLLLRLFIAGRSPRSLRAIDSVHTLRKEVLSPCEIEIVDVLKEPQLAEDERIVATPTLVRAMPDPKRRVIGDLSDTPTVLLGLELPTRLGFDHDTN